MTPEKVEDLRAARYRLVHVLRNNVEAMAVDVECHRDAIMHGFLCKIAVSLAALNDINQAYVTACTMMEAEDEAPET